MALTATAPPQLASELEAILDNPEIFKASIDRSNIVFTARKCKFGGLMPKSISNGNTSAGIYTHV